MKGRLFNNILLFFFSLFIGIILIVVVSEIAFFITHGDWYKNKSLHIRQKEQIDITKDINLIDEYSQILLHKIPDSDSALREYSELVNFRKKQGVYRVLCIGGSTTRGVGSVNSQTYPAFLRQILDTIKPGDFEVFNLGLHGGTTYDFIKRFHKASTEANFGWKDLNPDLVILAPVWNDFGDLHTRIHMRIAGSLKWIDMLDYIKMNLSSRCALGYYIYSTLVIICEKKADRYYRLNQGFFIHKLQRTKPRFRQRLSEVIDLWKRKGAEIWLVLFPGLIEENYSCALIRNLIGPNHTEAVFFGNRQYPLIQQADKEIITAVAKQYQIRYFDFSDIGRGIPLEEKFKLFVDVIHLHPQLNYWIAEAFANAIVSNKKGINLPIYMHYELKK